MSATFITIDTVTVSQIETLRDEAAEHGDANMAQTCERALESIEAGGYPNAPIQACCDAINCARAQVRS